MIRAINLFVTLMAFAGTLKAGETPDTISGNRPLVIEVGYKGEIMTNLYGGLRSGACYLGMVSGGLLFDSEKADWWKGTQIKVSMANTHGAAPSAELLGDLQVASNIEAGNHTFFQELFIRQRIGRTEITIGLQDLNSEFAASEYGGLFLNSSFGMIPVISANIPAPVFPLTSPGVTFKWNIGEDIQWLMAVYDGSPTNFDYNPVNLRWQFNEGDGILMITECHFRPKIFKMTGHYTAGAYIHHHKFERMLNADFPDSLDHTIAGVYGNADQPFWEQDNRSGGIFVQAGYSPSPGSANRNYLGAGVNLAGMLDRNGKDHFGLAVAIAMLSGKVGHETTLEFTFRYQFTPHLYLQPDFQYIINPAGPAARASQVKNCLAGIVRFGFEL